MQTIFTRGPSLNNRLTLALVLSVGLILVDHKLNGFDAARVYLNSFMSPLQYVANLPSTMLNWSAERVTSQQQLISENEYLSEQMLLMSEQLQRFQMLKTENQRLRALLDAPIRENIRKKVAQLMAVDNNPFSHQVVINRGASDDVYVSQPVLDESGIVGQVMEVGSTTSRVLLLTDVTHALPVRSGRNGIQFIVVGSGALDELYVEHVAHSVDIQVGDMLFSSGLGNVFPEGYPVAQVSSVTRDESRPFAVIIATPMAKLDRLKHLMLLWSDKEAVGDE
ncbi:rod shape-determining protein MreC [Alteromonas oceanisediminis]|uniref:rod shape-determining protein MreC n=1 Tax=Alteromonas oceanisediminis TaxID=2836180 RepID=UPI001BDA297C|nr:rod shape-determining protein MreC [Alteromonas oceanisediminis]MBT0586882.1 rod shape-determining protein MreC [Alteromonas oceanisediminis]